MAGKFIKSLIGSAVQGAKKSGGKYTFDAESKNQPELFFDGPKNIDKKKQAIREYRREASRLASIANKRIERLERNGLETTPAYKKYLDDGAAKFGVKGKTYNEVQAEVARLRRFIDSETSTVRGASRVLKEMAENTGIKYDNLQDLKEKSSRFFELSSKVEQYLRTVDDMASAIGYQKIWEAINTYTRDANIKLDGSDDDLDSMVKAITDAIKEYEEPASIWEGLGWYSLEKSDPNNSDPKK